MKLEEFDYTLPDHLIARYPAAKRSASRLLAVNKNTDELSHLHFHELVNLLRPEDLLVFNNSKVLRARLFGRKPSGGKIELLIERILGDNEALAHMRSNKTPKPGSDIEFDHEIKATLIERDGDLFRFRFNAPLLSVLDQAGHMPLPPYIDRADESFDETRYQTVYAQSLGSVAAPTAGLHFDEDLLSAIEAKGVATTFVTLHVGAGTFQPVRVENITDHRMHAEYLSVTRANCEAVRACKARGGRVIAIGTTSVRSLETASQSGAIQPFEGETNIFIYPGYHFHCVDAMVTNFHLPKSSLLMLVSAFMGKDKMLSAYQAAIEQEYRFFSYGDAMFLY